MQNDYEQVVKQILSIEQQLDNLIENQQYEQLLPLLERREQIIRSLENIDPQLANSIMQSDQKRIEKIKTQMQKLANDAIEMKRSQTAIKSYKDFTQAQGTRLDKKM
ncbi:MAG TPA: hypothetical protein PLP64_06410 [Pseudothermotoga sp.]|nr:hypothetical protein [Pseudothermotoga sp.]HOK83843.1 hypothetical protein [Pseudothermotoga sp.]HPP70254.1 hypothetical protein [Pseudothermotoga sp.]